MCAVDGEVLSSLRLSWLSCVCVAYLHHLDTSSQRRGRETPVALVGYTGYMQTFARPHLVRVPSLYFGSRLGAQYPKNSKIFL